MGPNTVNNNIANIVLTIQTIVVLTVLLVLCALALSMLALRAPDVRALAVRARAVRFRAGRVVTVVCLCSARLHRAALVDVADTTSLVNPGDLTCPHPFSVT